MFGFYQDGTYSPARLRRNRLLILVPTLTLVGLGFMLLFFGYYRLENLAALLVLLAFFSSSLWWVTASKTSGPAKVDPNTVDYFRRMMKGRKK